MLCGLQDHFQLVNNLYKLDCFNEYNVFSIPARKCNNKVHRGRPSGGLSLIYHQSLCAYATQIRVSNRVQGIKLDIPNSLFLVINTYFPNDPQTVDFNDQEFLQTLEDIKYHVNSVNNNFTIILMGDLNTNMSRNTTFVDIVKNFCSDFDVESVWSFHPCDFTYYQERSQGNRTIVSKSVIDHFCISSHSLNLCTEASPLHIAENRSFHDPIYLKLNTSVRTSQSENNDKPRESKLLWNRATPKQISTYKSDLSSLLSDINIDELALSCTNVHCTDQQHKDAIDDMCQDVFRSVSTAVSSNIPRTNITSKLYNPMPGWNDAVKELKDKSIFWKSVCVSADRPLDNNLHRLMKTTRHKYHFAIKKVKKHEKAIRKSKFLQACLNNKIEDIFSELKAMRNKGGHISKVNDGKNKQLEIAEHFKEMYQEIYNIHDDTAEFNRIKILNSNKINNTDLNIVNRITPAIVQKSIENFHNGKNDSFYEWRSDALKHAKELVATPLADLLKSMIIHGHIPPMFLLCSLIPIIKDNKASKMTSSNYRLIAITSLMLKILDHVVLDLFGSEMTPSYHQLCFQKGKSTSLCTWTVTETINYFTNRGSPIFLCLLDLTKAFDFVKLSTLFEKLSKKIPAILIRFLMASYTQQECFVTWDGHHSSTFSISNGVRQGQYYRQPCSTTISTTYISSWRILDSDAKLTVFTLVLFLRRQPSSSRPL